METEPKKNGTLKSLRKRHTTEYVSGVIGANFSSDALGEDIAAKFLSSGLISQKLVIDHFRLTYSRQEFESRVDTLKKTVEKIASYSEITITYESTSTEFIFQLSRSPKKCFFIRILSPDLLAITRQILKEKNIKILTDNSRNGTTTLLTECWSKSQLFLITLLPSVTIIDDFEVGLIC